MRAPSVYLNKGKLQTPVKNAHQLLFINGKYHDAKLKEGNYGTGLLGSDGVPIPTEKSGAIAFLKTKVFRIPPPAEDIYSHVLSIKYCVGFYDFVILGSDPKAIFINKNENTTFGHTSISNGSPVLLAGELFFDDKDAGTLSLWTNKSGHYRVGEHLTEKALKYKRMSMRSPEKLDLHIQNRIPVVSSGMLLPLDKFRAWDGEL